MGNGTPLPVVFRGEEHGQSSLPMPPRTSATTLNVTPPPPPAAGSPPPPPASTPPPARPAAGTPPRFPSTLPRTAVDREEPQAGHRELVQVPEGVAEQFTGPLGRRVRADRLGHLVGFGKRHLRVVAVDARARGEDEAADLVLRRRVQQVRRPLQVH